MDISFTLFHPKYEDLSLSPMVIDDASEMVTHMNDEETVKYLIGPPYPVSIEQVKDYISNRPLINGYRQEVAIRHHGKLIGEITLTPKKTPGTYILGYYLSRPYWNNGIVTLAVKTYLDTMVKLINPQENITIEAEYIMDNFASGKILEKCGFVEAGHEERTKNGQKMIGVKMVRVVLAKEQATDVSESSN